MCKLTSISFAGNVLKSKLIVSKFTKNSNMMFETATPNTLAFVILQMRGSYVVY